MSKLQHWVLTEDDQNIIWLGFDKKGANVNSIDVSVLDELNGILQTISSNAQAKGLVIYSLKEKGFIAGADLTYINQLSDVSQAVDFLRKGQAVYAKLASLQLPTVAMIDGFCLGGGYELALACDYRIATDESSTKIGLPEIKIGIVPGWGGTVRLPQLIGGFDALSKVILTGKAYAAKKAKKMGMIDEVVPLRQLKRAAIYFINKKPAKHKPTFLQSLSNQGWSRKLLASLIRKQVAKKAKENHYPAPYAAIDLWEQEGARGERAFQKEVETNQKLFEGETPANLIRLYFLSERMKDFGKQSDFEAKHVHVIGAGVMGGDIAAWCALKGLHVTLQDQTIEKISPAIARAHKLFKKRLRDKRLIEAAMDRLVTDTEGYGIAKADVIIEAVFENLEVKQSIFKRVEKEAKKDAILASNTSSIPLEEIAAGMKDATRLVGIHFFNPVPQMELVEIVSSDKTSAEVSEKSCSFVGQIGKLPLPVKSSPGFLVNRVLMPYLMECVHLLDEGYKGESIDKAATDFGMFMGPVELADTVGMDVCLAVAENLTGHFGGTVPDRLRQMVKEGKLGRKSGEGFYKYKNGKAIKEPLNTKPDSDIANRLILRLVNEANACLREGVVADADLLDGGMVFATGFAPFRGGPMKYADDFGKEHLNELLSKLASQYGERFKSNSINQ